MICPLEWLPTTHPDHHHHRRPFSYHYFFGARVEDAHLLVLEALHHHDHEALHHHGALHVQRILWVTT